MKPDLDAIRARAQSVETDSSARACGALMAYDALSLLAYIADLEERCRAYECMRSDIARALDTWEQEEVNDEA